jgi:hypothetical protein
LDIPRSSRQHRRHFDLDFRAVFDEPGNLQRGHGGKVLADDAAIGFADF